MSVWGGDRQTTPEFVRAAPTKGFGEIEATVIASLSAPGAPRPRPITTKQERRLCRIYSPVSTARGGKPIGGVASLMGQRYREDDALRRPHTADSGLMHRPSSSAKGTGASGGTNAISNIGSDDVAGSARLVMAQQRSRPMTSDASSRLRDQQSRGADGERPRGSTSRVDSDSGEGPGWQLRVSTPGGSRRRPPAVSHGALDTRKYRSSIDNSLMASLKNQATGESRGRRKQQQQPQPERPEQQEQVRPEDEIPRQREHTYVGPATVEERTQRGGSVDRRPPLKGMVCRNGENGTPPNRYWPLPGGAKEFLRPFIESNQKQLWAFDPAFVGKNHVEVYRHIVSKGNFEAVKRTLLEKEDALNKGTGSFLMADTIERFRGASARMPASSAPSNDRGPETGLGSSQRPTGGKPPPTERGMEAIELDPFQCGGCNTDKLEREGSRRQDLLIHAKNRDNLFCRRRGYEPGDFLKQPTARLTGGIFNSTVSSRGSSSRRRSSGRKNSARSAADAAAAAATESRRQVHRRNAAKARLA